MSEFREVDGKRVGYIKEYGNLRHIVVLNAGHMVPHDVPAVALDMINSFVQSAVGKQAGRADDVPITQQPVPVEHGERAAGLVTWMDGGRAAVVRPTALLPR